MNVLKLFLMIFMSKKLVDSHLQAVVKDSQILTLENLIINLLEKLDKQLKSFWRSMTKIGTVSSIRKKLKLPSSASSKKTPINSNTSHRMYSATIATMTVLSVRTNSPTSALSITSAKWRFSAFTERSITPKGANAE